MTDPRLPEPRPLGREATTRREALLQELRPIVQRRATRRTMRRLALCLPLIAATALTITLTTTRPPTPHPILTQTHPTLPPPSPAHTAPPTVAVASPRSTLTVITTKPGLAAAMSTRPRATPTIDDAALITALREAGHDTGLVRIDGRVVIAGNTER